MSEADELVEVSTPEALAFVEHALRNWEIEAFSNDELEDLRAALEVFARRAITAARAAVLEEAWQPIESFEEPTALSSGCGVLIACADGTVGEAYYRNFDDDDAGWWWVNTSWGDYPEPERPVLPTHWRPLPDPPRALRGE